MADLFTLSSRDRQLIQELLLAHKGRGVNTRQRPREGGVDHQEMPGPEVYVVRTPLTGIPANPIGDLFPGSGSGQGDEPGHADCDIFQPVSIGGTVLVALERVGTNRTVYNTGGQIGGDRWIIALRDKYGRWFAIHPGQVWCGNYYNTLSSSPGVPESVPAFSTSINGSVKIFTSYTKVNRSGCLTYPAVIHAGIGAYVTKDNIPNADRPAYFGVYAALCAFNSANVLIQSLTGPLPLVAGGVLKNTTDGTPREQRTGAWFPQGNVALGAIPNPTFGFCAGVVYMGQVSVVREFPIYNDNAVLADPGGYLAWVVGWNTQASANIATNPWGGALTVFGACSTNGGFNGGGNGYILFESADFGCCDPVIPPVSGAPHFRVQMDGTLRIQTGAVPRVEE